MDKMIEKNVSKRQLYLTRSEFALFQSFES